MSGCVPVLWTSAAMWVRGGVMRVKFGQRIYIGVGRRDVQWACIGGSDDRGDQGDR